MRKTPALLSLLVAALVLIPATPAQAEGVADLSMTATWVGNGLPRAAVGDVVTFAYVITNLGPDVATGLTAVDGGDDQVDTPLGRYFIEDATLAAGESLTGTFWLFVCCLPKGEGRVADVGGSVGSDAIDPNPGNNIASLDLRIIGPYGTCAYGTEC